MSIEMEIDPGVPWGDQTIEVLCLVCPDGSIFWVERQPLPGSLWPDNKRVQELIDDWRDNLPPGRRQELEDARTQGGAVVLRMMRKDFENVNAT